MSDDKPSREVLDAFIDGQLPPEEATRVAALLPNHADLQAYVARQQALRSHLDAAFAPIVAAAVPELLLQSVRQTRISTLSKASSGFEAWRSWFSKGSSWRPAIPAAAALALGLVVGIAIDRPSDSELRFFQNASTGEVVARGELVHALNEQLASEDNRVGTARVGLSFRNKNGEDCRTFSLSGATNSTSGVACRAGDSWVVAAMVSTGAQPSPGAPYQMAGSAMPSVIRNVVNEMIAGAPFDAAAERAARQSHWQGGR